MNRKRHNEVATGLAFVAVALMVLSFMGIAQHFGLSGLTIAVGFNDVRSHLPRHQLRTTQDRNIR